MADSRVVTVTYREIAERFSIGIEGARIKAKRRAAKGLWRIIPGNHPQDIIRVEIPEDEFASGQPSQRGVAHSPNDGVQALPPQQEGERRDANDIDALVELISQLAAQSATMTDRLIDAEKGKAEAERDAAIAKVALASAEAQLADMQEQHLSALKEMRDRMSVETNAVKADLEALQARSWWRRLVG